MSSRCAIEKTTTAGMLIRMEACHELTPLHTGLIDEKSKPYGYGADVGGVGHHGAQTGTRSRRG